MALIKCKSCGGDIGDTAQKCLICGAVVSPKNDTVIPPQSNDTVGIIALVALLIGGVWAWSTLFDSPQPETAAPRSFVESQFYWDSATTPYKDIIIAGVNKVARENASCAVIDPSSAYISSSRGTPVNPVFFVTCDQGGRVFNVFFSKSDVEASLTLSATENISRNRATTLCREYVMSAATNPDTVDFSNFLDVVYDPIPGGRTRLRSSFSADTDSGTTQKFDVNCLFEASQLIEAELIETQ